MKQLCGEYYPRLNALSHRFRIRSHKNEFYNSHLNFKRKIGANKIERSHCNRKYTIIKATDCYLMQ